MCTRNRFAKQIRLSALALCPGDCDHRQDITTGLWFVQAPIGPAFATMILAGLVLGGCALDIPIKTIEPGPTVVTGSVQPVGATEKIDQGDTKIINDTVAQAPVQPAAPSLLDWRNPETGNRGTVSAINEFIADDQRKCRKFKTTLDSFTGISLYNGESCELHDGLWVLTGLSRQNPAV